DQLAAAWLPMYGHPLVQTPNLSELAAGATVFDSAYSAYPLCAPSRAAMLCGRYASAVEVWDNAAELRAGTPTAVHALRAAGYHTAVAGKMHFVGPDQLHGFEERLTTDIYPADVDWTPDWSRSLDDPLPWYHTMESVLRPGICAASMQTDYDQEVSFHAVRKLYDIARHRGDQPFLLFVSFTNPHDPWEIPARHWDRYRREDIDDPAVPAIALAAADPHSRRLRAMCGVDQASLSREDIRRARHGYYAAVSYLDERVGEVLAALRGSGLADRTTVLFTADHGEMLGERGLWYKMSFLEHSARVPLIVRRPGGSGLRGAARPVSGPAAAARRVSEPVSLVDLAPTLLSLAGVDAGGLQFDGVSLAGSLSEPGSDAPNGAGSAAPGHPVISEYHAEGVQAPAAMVRQGDHKLIASLEDPDLLYDLRFDPRELRDLSGARPDVVTSLHAALASRLDLAEIDRRVRVSQRERRLVTRALRQGHYTSWDYQPQVDATMQYVRSREDLYELQRRARLDAPATELD
ncbi:MAG: choline-sulfatase, partial [Solirubrobacteraceae bacterium]|nr:choline-sulfatase [Solirubrobacteraceae bacterium]